MDRSIRTIIDTDKRARLVSEFIYKGNLQMYEAELEILINKILDAGCYLSNCDTCLFPRIEWTNDNNGIAHIRMSFKQVKDKPLHYIWDVLHEFGHFLSGPPNGAEKTIPRERQAWDFGQENLKDYPALYREKNDYVAYRDKLLNTYNKT